MSTTVKYKGNTLTTVSNATKTLKTAGKYMEGDVVLTDVSGGSEAISVVDTEDTHGGTIRTITAVDISDTTATASDVAQGKYFYTADGTKTEGTSTGGGGGNSDLKGIIEGTATSPNLPSDTTAIRNYCFYYYGNLGLTSLPSGVTSIGEYAFQNSGATLTSLPNGLTSIGQHAFHNCVQLALTSLPNGLTNIPNHAFAYCMNIEIATLPTSIVGLIGNYAFQSCYKVAISSVPSGVTGIGQYTFSECSSITTMTLPSTVTTIGADAFYNCENLENVTGAGVITSIGSSSFTRCQKLKTASFPNASINSLGTAFGNSSMSAYADQALEFIDIGSTKAIAANSFANCYSLVILVLRRSDAICTLSNVSAFTKTPMNGYNSLTGTVYVPSALISSYQTATNWSTLYNNGTVTFVAIEGSEYEI